MAGFPWEVGGATLDSIARQNEQILLQNEIDRLDREWAMAHPGRSGRGALWPAAGAWNGSYLKWVAQATAALLSLWCLACGAAMAAGWASRSADAFAVGLTLLIPSLPFLPLALVFVVYGRRFERRYLAYSARRKELIARLDAAR